MSFRKSACCGSHHIDNGDGLSVCGVDNGYAHRSQDAGRSQGDDLETDEKIDRVGDFVSERSTAPRNPEERVSVVVDVLFAIVILSFSGICENMYGYR